MKNKLLTGVKKIRRFIIRFAELRALLLLRANMRAGTRRAPGCWLLPKRHTVCEFHRSARINLGGTLTLNNGRVRGSRAEMLLKMEENAALNVVGDFSFAYGCDVYVFQGAQLTLGKNSYVNKHTEIRCKKSVSIGDDTAIAGRVIILDTDAHSVYSDGGTSEMTAPVRIGNHVWIGAGSVILKGVSIGDGAIVAAGSVVNRDVPPRTVAAGVPAGIKKEEVRWAL